MKGAAVKVLEEKGLKAPILSHFKRVGTAARTCDDSIVVFKSPERSNRALSGVTGLHKTTISLFPLAARAKGAAESIT